MSKKSLFKEREKNCFRNGGFIYIQCESFAIYLLYACYAYTVVYRTLYTHICHFILLFFLHPFILILINLLGIWLRMLPLGQVKAEYTFWKINLKKTPSLSLSLPFFSLSLLFFFFCSFCGTHHPILK